MPKSRTSLALSDEILDRVKKEAAEQHRSVHNMLVCIIEEYFEAKDRESGQKKS